MNTCEIQCPCFHVQFQCLMFSALLRKAPLTWEQSWLMMLLMLMMLIKLMMTRMMMNEECRMMMNEWFFGWWLLMISHGHKMKTRKTWSLWEAFPSWIKSSIDLFSKGLAAKSARADRTHRRPHNFFGWLNKPPMVTMVENIIGFWWFLVVGVCFLVIWSILLDGCWIEYTETYRRKMESLTSYLRFTQSCNRQSGREMSGRTEEMLREISMWVKGTFNPMSHLIWHINTMSVEDILNAKSTAFTPEHSCKEWLSFSPTVPP